MHIDILIKKQERGLEILESIKALERRTELHQGSIDGFPGTFPKLRRKYLNNIDTIERGIKRLYIKFENL